MPTKKGQGNVNTQGFRLDNSPSESNKQRSNVGEQGGGGSQVAGPEVPGVSNPKGRVAMRVGGLARRSQQDLMQQQRQDDDFTSSAGKK